MCRVNVNWPCISLTLTDWYIIWWPKILFRTSPYQTCPSGCLDWPWGRFKYESINTMSVLILMESLLKLLPTTWHNRCRVSPEIIWKSYLINIRAEKSCKANSKWLGRYSESHCQGASDCWEVWWGVIKSLEAKSPAWPIWQRWGHIWKSPAELGGLN